MNIFKRMTNAVRLRYHLNRAYRYLNEAEKLRGQENKLEERTIAVYKVIDHLGEIRKIKAENYS